MRSARMHCLDCVQSPIVACITTIYDILGTVGLALPTLATAKSHVKPLQSPKPCSCQYQLRTSAWVLSALLRRLPAAFRLLGCLPAQ